ncbi:MAG: alpha/beta hydrolase [Bacteroidales bacterium]|nr:alpha/beta hydrolase [Bacteroidales bacterium]
MNLPYLFRKIYHEMVTIRNFIYSKALSILIILSIVVTLILLATNLKLMSQDIQFGFSERNGRYLNTGDAKIYYEVYGQGQPVVLLHGGYGYIDGFKQYIPVLSKEFKVIAIASRGYGKSEIGNTTYSYELLANDVKKIIENEGNDKAIVMGTSDGAMIAYILASKYPNIVSSVVAMGGPLGTSGYDKEGLDWLRNLNSEEFKAYRPDLLKIMPQPERYADFVENLKIMWSTPNILQFDDLRKIECPVLLLFGDRDLFCTMDHITQIYKSIPGGQLAIIPNSTHSDVSFRNTTILKRYILQFIRK